VGTGVAGEDCDGEVVGKELSEDCGAQSACCLEGVSSEEVRGRGGGKRRITPTRATFLI